MPKVFSNSIMTMQKAKNVLFKPVALYMQTTYTVAMYHWGMKVYAL